MDTIQKDKKSCKIAQPPTAARKEEPDLYVVCGVPALVAFNDAYRVARRIERGCEMSERGFLAGARAERVGGEHE